MLVENLNKHNETRLRKESRIEISWEIETSHCELDIHPLSLSLSTLYKVITYTHAPVHGRTHFLAFFLSSIPIVVRSFEPRVKLNIVQAATNEASPSYWLKGARINAATRRKHLRVYAFFFFPPTIEKKTSIFSETDRIDASTIIFKADGIYIYINAISVSKELFRCR